MTFDLRYKKFWPEDELIRYNKTVTKREKIFKELWPEMVRDFLARFQEKAGEKL